MTDRYKGFAVTLEHDLRADDAEAVIAAIRQMRGVASVTPVVGDLDDHMNRECVRHDLERKLWGALRDEKGAPR